MLFNWGMKPTVVDGGERAVEEVARAAAAGTPFKLALVDVMMPHMDGFELVRRLRDRADASGLAIIMLSSADRPEDAAHAKRLGVARCIVKPVTQSFLLNSITAALGTARGDETPGDAFSANRAEDFVPRRILLAEDGLVNRKVAVSLLQQRGHHVTAVENGQLAVEAFRSGEFDLVLTDIQMPVLDGFAATAAIRELEAGTDQRIPIIAMTAHAMAGDRDRCLNAGMDSYVSKPFRPHELFGAVEQVRPGEKGGAGAGGSRGAAPTAAASSAASRPPAFDADEALKNVGGSRSIFAEMAELFAVECPKQMAEIEAAYAVRDAQAVMRAAHTLKGSVSLFAAATATAAARQIEQLGREGKLEEFPAAWATLEREVGELLAALAGSG